MWGYDEPPQPSRSCHPMVAPPTTPLGTGQGPRQGRRTLRLSGVREQQRRGQDRGIEVALRWHSPSFTGGTQGVASLQWHLKMSVLSWQGQVFPRHSGPTEVPGKGSSPLPKAAACPKPGQGGSTSFWLPGPQGRPHSQDLDVSLPEVPPARHVVPALAGLTILCARQVRRV